MQRKRGDAIDLMNSPARGSRHRPSPAHSYVRQGRIEARPKTSRELKRIRLRSSFLAGLIPFQRDTLELAKAEATLLARPRNRSGSALSPWPWPFIGRPAQRGMM